MSTWTLIYEAVCWPFQRAQRGVLAWVLAVAVTLSLLHSSLRDKVEGYNTCDFAGQWMHGRAFYREACQDLYLIEPGKELLAEGYSGKHLQEQISDILEKGVHKGLADNGLAGALYPPTASMLFSLLANFSPPIAQSLAVVASLLLCYLSGWMISQITGQRLQWGEATLLILFFPNNFMGMMLGQNQALSLAILVTGWYCYSRGWSLTAGLVWGLFAFKPVFAVALLLVPLGMRNPRWLLGMVISGLLFVAATLPFTKGIEPWLRWLKVGRHAEQIYQKDRNWVWMSRDLVGLPRRKMWDIDSFKDVWGFNVGEYKPGYQWYATTTEGETIVYPQAWLFWGEKHDWKKHQRVYLDHEGTREETASGLATIIGYLLLGSVAAVTLLICWWKRLDLEPPDGIGAIFVLTGSLLCVFHFMHYDLLSFALPVLLALGQWSHWRRGRKVFFLFWYLLWLSRTYAFFYGDAILQVPWETYLLLWLWAWSGIACLRSVRAE